ncbi:MAG: glycosyltransferase family 4 protein [Myxococcales bacterium]|nr:glycosyltransferase family 4 protein [Myxococcales bacterium]
MGRSAAFARLVGRLGEALEVRRVQGHAGSGDLPPRALGVDLSGRGSVGAAFAMWRAVGEAVRTFAPDVVLTDGLDLPPVRAPVVAVVRDLVGTGWDVVGGARGWRVRARRCAALVVPHDLVRRDLTDVGVDPFRVTVIPELVDLPARLLPPPVAEDVVTLLHPGAIHPAKGQHLSIDAVSRLSAEDKARVRLVVAGPATNPRYLAQLKVAASGQPVSFVTEETARTWPELLASCRVVLYPTSLDEGCPDAALLAMAHGLAVLAPDRPTLRDQLGPGAILLPPGHVTAMRDTLSDVLAGRLDPAPIGREGAAFVAERHGWPAVWQRYRTLLASVVR